MSCYEKIVDSGAGSTDYLLSMGNQNRAVMSSMPDSEGCDCDGQVSGSDFCPASEGPDRASF